MIFFIVCYFNFPSVLYFTIAYFLFFENFNSPVEEMNERSNKYTKINHLAGKISTISRFIFPWVPYENK